MYLLNKFYFITTDQRFFGEDSKAPLGVGVYEFNQRTDSKQTDREIWRAGICFR
jgi:hypothetical protein